LQKTSVSELIRQGNPNPGTSPYITSVLTGNNCGAVRGILEPHTEGPYHYHRRHEAIFVILSGEGIEKIDDVEYPLVADDILYIAAGEKHQMINRSDKTFYYFEVQIPAPDKADVVRV